MTEINPEAAASLVGALNNSSFISGLTQDQYALLMTIFKIAHDITADPSDYVPEPFGGEFTGSFQPLETFTEKQVKMLLGYAAASVETLDAPNVIVKLATDESPAGPDSTRPPTVVKGIWRVPEEG